MPDLLLLRATPSIGCGADAVALAPFDAAPAYRVLRARQRHDLAAPLEHTLSPEECATLAAALYRYVSRETRSRFFRSYRALLPDDEAQALVYLAGWLRRAAQAGCRITRAPAASVSPPHSENVPAHPLPRPLAPSHLLDHEGQRERDHDGARGIMPPWLQAPRDSVWSDGPPALPDR